MTRDPEPAKIESFIHALLGDANGTAAIASAWLGDRLGLFTTLAAAGPVTTAELAERTGFSPIYLRDWLGGMAAAGYLEHDAATGRFVLPPEQALVLAGEGGPCFLGAVPQLILATLTRLEELAEAFRTGGGVSQASFPSGLLEGQERLGRSRYEHQLVQAWLPAAPAVKARLVAGGSVLDVGCGSGVALAALARAFPAARFAGVDAFAPAIERARENARAAGVEERVTLTVADATELPREAHDVVTAFDVVHDAVDPLALMTSMRNALKPDGLLFLLEPDGCPHVHESRTPKGRFLHAQALFHCTTVSLAQGGQGMGCNAGEEALRALAERAGFRSMERVAIGDPFDGLWVLGR
jgi:2-polyprenyl-3-methyl-5-hydroxy-6-metoxy-1,4-benzoquinol methylase